MVALCSSSTVDSIRLTYGFYCYGRRSDVSCNGVFDVTLGSPTATGGRISHGRLEGLTDVAGACRKSATVTETGLIVGRRQKVWQKRLGRRLPRRTVFDEILSLSPGSVSFLERRDLYGSGHTVRPTISFVTNGGGTGRHVNGLYGRVSLFVGRLVTGRATDNVVSPEKILQAV